MDKSDCMRTVRFFPYRKGQGPSFTLKLYYLGSEHIGYELRMHENRKTVVLFEGEDFRPSPLHSIDGDAAVESLMGFLTLKPGDTDREYFKDYAPTQLEFCQQHAEALDLAVICRFNKYEEGM